MSQEMDMALKTMNTVANIEKLFMEQLQKMLDMLMANKDDLKKDDIKKYEKMQYIVKDFNEYISKGGVLGIFNCSAEDKANIERICKENDMAFTDMEKNKNAKDFIYKYDGIHFAFENMSLKDKDGNYQMFIKNTDMNKLNQLKEYMDKEGISNSIELQVKDIRNLLKIDENKELNTLDIIKQSTYETIANSLNANQIPFEVANQDDGVRIIYERQDEGKVLELVDSIKAIDIKERANLISERNKEFNNRSENKEMVKEALKVDKSDNKPEKDDKKDR